MGCRPWNDTADIQEENLPIIEISELQTYVEALEEDQAMDEYLVRKEIVSSGHTCVCLSVCMAGGIGDGCPAIHYDRQPQV